ncbi:hypothetical protein FOZ61_009848 [Perkinsus olseni]|uniref:Uncharacterized protein n=1 Tax=Perkinsus olseni TaxID=32597 RepID=A0A7J6M4A9_PEROL|nr:hypothetical protein FOZ61_009848 [Perkinsus olseni]
MSRRCTPRKAAIEARKRLSLGSRQGTRRTKGSSRLTQRSTPKVDRKSSLCEDTSGSCKKSGRRKFWFEDDEIGELARDCRAGRKTLWEKLAGYSIQFDFDERRLNLKVGEGDLGRGESQVYLVNEVVFDIRNCLGASMFAEGFPECKLKEVGERGRYAGSTINCASLCIQDDRRNAPKGSSPIVLASCLYRYDAVSRDAMILLFTIAKSVEYPALRGRRGYEMDCRGRGLGRFLDAQLCEWLMKYKECRSAYVEMLNQQVAKFWMKIGYVPLISRHDVNQTFRGFHGTVLARKMLWRIFESSYLTLQEDHSFKRCWRFSAPMRIALVCFFSNAIVLILLLLVAAATAGKPHKRRNPEIDSIEEATGLTADDDGKAPWGRLEAQYRLFVKLLDIAIPVMAMVFGICFFIEMNLLIDAKEHGSMADVAYVPVSSIENILLAKEAAEASWVPPKTVSVEVELPIKQVVFPPHLVAREALASQSLTVSPGSKERVALDMPTSTGGKIQLILDHAALASVIKNKYSRKEADITLDLGTLLSLNTSGALIGAGGAKRAEWPLGQKVMRMFLGG